MVIIMMTMIIAIIIVIGTAWIAPAKCPGAIDRAAGNGG
jgi:hypothetical protein